MPFIHVKVSEKLDEQKIEAIKTKLGKAVSLLPGKSEAYLMVQVEDGCHLYFKGNQAAPTAMTEVSIFGTAPRASCEALTGEVCRILEELAGIPQDRSYVTFRFVENWGYNGFLF